MPKSGIEDINVVDTARFVQWWNDWSTAGDRQQLYAAAWKVNHRSALEFVRALAQARINWDVDAPVTGASMAIFYASGVVFAVAAGLLLALDLWRIVSGQMPDSELLHIAESEELAAVGSQLPQAAPAPTASRQ